MVVSDAQVSFRHWRLTHALATAIGDASSVAEGLGTTLRLFCEAGGWVVGQVWWPDANGQALTCAPEWYQSQPGFEAFHETSSGMRFRRGEPLVGVVWDRAEVVWVDDVGRGPTTYRRAGAAADAGLSTALLVPVVNEGEVKAVLEFLTRGHPIQEPELRDSIDSAAAQLGSLIARKEAETRLRHSEARFRAVAETAHDAIVSIDATGAITYVNAETLRLLDQPLEALLGAPVSVIIPERFHQAHRAGFSRYLSTGESRLLGTSVTVSARRRDASEVPVELSLSTWEVEGCRYFTAIIRDVSERQRAQAALERTLVLEREAAERLRELDELKNTFLDAVSHDLRSPLASIRAATSLLQRDADEHMLGKEQRKQYLLGVNISAEKMRALLDDLLDLERLTGGEVVLIQERVDLAGLLRDLVTEHHEAFGDRTVHLQLKPVVAEVDAPKVERIVENLLLNAVRHAPDGTPIWVSLQVQGSAALICVDDSGPGVPEPMRQLIFERYRQVRRRPGPGLGIGLSLVARFAELHAGRAWVQERPGGGASFRVLLPLHVDKSVLGGAHGRRGHQVADL